MPVYYVNEAAFELPWDDAIDKSVNVFERPIDADNHLSVSVQRGRFERGETLEVVLDRHMEKASRSLRSFEVLDRRDIEVSGRPAVDIGTRWRSDKSVIYTRQCLVDTGTSWLIVSANAPMTYRVDADAGLERMLSSLRLRA